MSKYAGIHFLMDSDSGIAEISIYNNTKSTSIVSGQTVDLYFAGADGTATPRESVDYVYWRKLPYEDDSYTLTVQHSGDHNASAAGPSYAVQIEEYFIQEDIDPEIEVTAIGYHTDASGTLYTFSVSDNPEESIETYQIATFSPDGLEDTFILAEEYRASEFIEWSDDSGADWKAITLSSITWGSNNPDYDDETIDDDGYFGIKFVTPPDSGIETVQIKYKPKINKMYLETTIKQPNDGSDYIEYRIPVKLLDHSIELIP